MKNQNMYFSDESEIRYLTPDPLRRKRNGKIAALDRDTREEVNRRLQDGESAEKILAWINSLPKTRAVLERRFDGKPITKQNLSQWRCGGGYRDWVQHEEQAHEQEIRDDLRARGPINGNHVLELIESLERKLERLAAEIEQKGTAVSRRQRRSKAEMRPSCQSQTQSGQSVNGSNQSLAQSSAV
jgi:hypothetical protein